MVKRRLDARDLLAGEDNLSRRIAFERKERKWTYERVAEGMTAAGCPINRAAVHRIENGNGPGKPPRQISVDELLAFSEVFNIPVLELLTPLELLRKERAKDLLVELKSAAAAVGDALDRLLAGYAEWARLTAVDRDVHEYIVNQLKAADFWQSLTTGIARRVTVNGIGEQQVVQALWDIQAVTQHTAYLATEEASDGEH